METKEPKFRMILCVDVDAFYAQCESIRLGIDHSVPLAVRQGNTLISVNYAARMRGVSKIANYKEALQCCPELKMVNVDMIKADANGNEVRSTIEDKFKRPDKINGKFSLEYYRSESAKIFETFSKFCKTVEEASIGKGILDLTDEVKNILESPDFSREWTSEWKGVLAGGETFIPESLLEKGLMIAAEIAEKISQEIAENFKYTCSVGISYNKMLAKFASELNKPDKQTIITPRYCMATLEKLEVNKIKNFGGKISKTLKEHNINTLVELQALTLKELAQIFKGDERAKYIYFRCRGFDEEEVESTKVENKSIGSSKTFVFPFSDLNGLYTLGDLVAADVNFKISEFYDKTGYVPQTVTVGYYDHKMNGHKSKSLSINMLIPKSQFKTALISKYHEIIHSLEKCLFPCASLSISVRNFVKHDLKEYEFSLDAFFKPKQASQENKHATPTKTQLPLKKDDATLKAVNLADGNLVTEFIESEMTICEKCGKSIPVIEFDSHTDFHYAEDLDREMNPHKRKYNQKRNYSDFQKESAFNFSSDRKDSNSPLKTNPLTKMPKISKTKGLKKISSDKGSITTDSSGNSKVNIPTIQAYFKKSERKV